MALEALISIIGTVFASSAVGAIVGALITQSWTRRLAKKVPKTTERAKVYEAILIHLICVMENGKIRRPSGKTADLRPLLARLALYGESRVVEAMSQFVAAYEQPQNGALPSALVDVIREMRTSRLTGTDTPVMLAIETMLAPKSI